MSRKRIKANSPKKERPAADVSFVSTMRKQIQKGKEDRRMRETAKAQADMLAAVSEEMGYAFAGLQIRSKEMEHSFRRGFAAAIKLATQIYQGLEDDEDTKPMIAEATERAVTAYNQQCIDTGVLVRRNIQLLEVPKARVYPDGRTEAASPRDLDIKQIKQKTIAIAEKFKMTSALRG